MRRRASARGRRWVALAPITALLYIATPAAAEAGAAPPAQPPTTSSTPPPPRSEPARSNKLCRLIVEAAASHGLPVGFFARLIWAESRFRADAVSPKGAQGIAQFMPG